MSYYNKGELRKLLEELKYCNQSNKNSKAEYVLNELIEKYPSNPKVKFEEALFLWHQKGDENINKALLLFKEIIDNNMPNRLSAMYEYVKLSVYIKYFTSDLEDYFKELIDSNYKVRQVEYYYGKYYEKQGNYNMAKYHYEISSDLGFEKANAALVNLMIKSGENVKELNEVKDIYNKETKTIDEVSIKVRYLLSKDRTSEVFELLKQAETFLKNQYINDANIFFFFKGYLDLGEVDEARRIYNSYEYTINMQEMKYYFKARLALCDENIETAINYFKQIINIDREYVSDSYYFLSKIAYKQQDYELYEKYLKELYEHDHSDSSIMMLANYYLRVDKDKSIEYLNKLSSRYKKLNDGPVRQLKCLLNLPLNDEDYEFYSIEQMINFSFEKAIEHINYHKLNGTVYFNDNIDVKELYKDVQKEISIKNPSFIDVLDHYILKRENIGSGKKGEYDYMEVVVIPFTNNIITMFPVASDNIFAMNYYKKKEKNKELKLNRKSQIEKFYARYGK